MSQGVLGDPSWKRNSQQDELQLNVVNCLHVGQLGIESLLVKEFKPSLDLRAQSIIFTIIVTIAGSIVLSRS